MNIYQPKSGEVLSPTKSACCAIVARSESEFFLGPLLAARGLGYEIYALDKVTLKLVQPDDQLIVNGEAVKSVCFTGEAKVFAFEDQYCVVTNVMDDPKAAKQEARSSSSRKTKPKASAASDSKE